MKENLSKKYQTLFLTTYPKKIVAKELFKKDDV
jgi:hypothetical protein